VAPRTTDLERARRGVEELLRGLGHDPDGEPALEGVGLRVAEAWARDLLAGETIDVERVLREGSVPAAPTEKGVVALRSLSTVTVCPHHLMPAVGEATVIYLPGDRIAGLGAIARVVDGFARRLVLQEEVGEQVARALVETLGARGALCRLSMLHTCLVARGERKHEARVDTVALAGSLTRPGGDRELAMAELRA
jgi:GTP cyclohydrolase I